MSDLDSGRNAISLSMTSVTFAGDPQAYPGWKSQFLALVDYHDLLDVLERPIPGGHFNGGIIGDDSTGGDGVVAITSSSSSISGDGDGSISNSSSSPPNPKVLAALVKRSKQV